MAEPKLIDALSTVIEEKGDASAVEMILTMLRGARGIKASLANTAEAIAVMLNVNGMTLVQVRETTQVTKIRLTGSCPQCRGAGVVRVPRAPNISDYRVSDQSNMLSNVQVDEYQCWVCTPAPMPDHLRPASTPSHTHTLRHPNPIGPLSARGNTRSQEPWHMSMPPYPKAGQ